MTVNKQTPYAAPVVDHLSIRVVVDSRYENILPKETHRFVQVEHVGDIPGKMIHTLAAEWGLSLHLVSQAQGARAEVLIALRGAVACGVGEAHQHNVRIGRITVERGPEECGNIPPVKRLQHHFVRVRKMIDMHSQSPQSQA